MHYPRHAFLQILMIELKDLECDIEHLIVECAEDLKKEKISNYVYYGNSALMNNELSGIKQLYQSILGLDPDAFESVQQITEWVTEQMEHLCRNRGTARCLCSLVRRKVEKVLGYIDQTAPHLEPHPTCC